MFYITTIFDNMKYELIFHKGTTKPELESLNGWDYHSEIRSKFSDEEQKIVEYTHKWKTPAGTTTDEKNGTTIRIPIENSSDKAKFTQEIKFQLAYFDNVYFENWGVTNSYKIYEGKYFKFRSDIDVSNTNIHLCVGKVRYPIDITKIRINNSYIKIPIAVKFDIGELNITPSRESLRYDDAGIKLIEERVTLAGNEIIEMFDAQNPELEDLRAWQRSLGDTPRIWFDKEANHYLNLWSHSGMSKNFRFKPLSGLAIKKTPNNLFFMWEAFAYISTDGKRHDISTWQSNREVDNNFILNKKYLIVKDTDRASIYTDLKIAEQSRYNDTYLIRRKKLDSENTFKLLGLKTDEKDASTKVLGKAKTVIGYIRKITELVEEGGMKYYSDHKADEAWIAVYKRSIIESSAAWRRKAAQKIFYKNVPRFSGEEDTVANFQKRTGILVYGYKDDRQKLVAIENAVTENRSNYKNITATFSKRGTRRLYSHQRQKKAFQVIMIAKSVLEDIVGPKKTIYWEDFIKTGYFKKTYTAYLMWQKFHELKFENRALRERYLPTFKEDYAKVNDLIGRYFSGNFYSISNSLLKICEEKIKPIASMMKVVDDFIAKYNFHIPLIGAVKEYEITDKDEATIVWLLKYEKIRLKNQYYLKSKEVVKQEQGVYSIFKTINNFSSITKQLNYVEQDNNTSSTSVPVSEIGEDLYSHIGGGEILEECDTRRVGDPQEGNNSLQQEAIRCQEEEDCENSYTGENSSERESGEECSSSEGFETTDQEGSEERESREENIFTTF